VTTQALPPSVDQQLADARTALAQAQVRITELEAQVNRLRGENDKLRAIATEVCASGSRPLGYTDDVVLVLYAPLKRLRAALAARAGEGVQ
jgi:phage shock protein A